MHQKPQSDPAPLTHKISFLPSGRTCSAQANETILEASLRSGLSPNYGCSNGNCGDCKASLKSGEIERNQHHDYAFTASQLTQGSFLMCANRAISDIEVEAEITRGPEDIPIQDIETRVRGIDFLDPQVVRLYLQTSRIRRLRFTSGQSVTLSVGDKIQSTIAMASCPCDDRNLYFHVPDIPGDDFSELVFGGGLSLRDTVRIQGPQKGKLYLDEDSARDSLMLCWHTGFAPIISLIEHAMSLELESDIHLYRFSPTPDHQYLPGLGRSWSDAYDNIYSQLMDQRITLLSSVDDCEHAFSDIAAQTSDLSNVNVYTAGPPNFVKAAQNVFGQTPLFRTHVDWLGVIE